MLLTGLRTAEDEVFGLVVVGGKKLRGFGVIEIFVPRGFTISGAAVVYTLPALGVARAPREIFAPVPSAGP